MSVGGVVRRKIGLCVASIGLILFIIALIPVTRVDIVINTSFTLPSGTKCGPYDTGTYYHTRVWIYKSALQGNILVEGEGVSISVNCYNAGELRNIYVNGERIRLFKEINRVHREMYGWKLLYENAWGGDYIDIESEVRLNHGKWVPIGQSDAGKYYFQDYKGKDIPSFWGIFAWEAYDFIHLNPYKFLDFGKNKPLDEDFISDSFGKRIRPDVSHPVDCLGTMIEMLQNKVDGRIWISSNWLYHPDCYGSGEGFGDEIYRTLVEAGGVTKNTESLWLKYKEITDINRHEFQKALEGYFKGGKLQYKYWDGGYLFAASKERRIKTLEQLNEAIEEEDEHFHSSLEEFVGWFNNNVINLGEKAEEGLRRRMMEFYAAYPCNIAKKWCKLLIEEDKVEPSDVYLWWGGEPNSDSCYAFLTLFFEFNPNEIGTTSFDESVSRNLRSIINIAEKDRGILSSHRDYEPQVWKAVFS